MRKHVEMLIKFYLAKVCDVLHKRNTNYFKALVILKLLVLPIDNRKHFQGKEVEGLTQTSTERTLPGFNFVESVV